MRSVVVCNGNFCRARGATVEEFHEAAAPAEVDVRVSHCTGMCLFSPVVSVTDEDDVTRVLFQIHGERVQTLLDSLRTGAATDMPQWAAP